MKKLNLFLLILLLPLFLYSKTYYVSKSGNDKNKGNKSSSFLTISKGASMLNAGDTLFVCEGVYRERVTPPRGGEPEKPIVYMGEPNKNVVIKGSDVWNPRWESLTSEVFYAIPDEKMFNDDCYKDNKNPFKVATSSTPYGREGRAEINFGYKGDSTIVYNIGQLFVNGEMYIQHPFLSEVNEMKKTWFYDKSSGRIYVHFPDQKPEKQTIEISTRRRIFAPHKRQLGYIVVQGFVMEHCGNQYPANFWEAKHSEWQQAGAVGTRSGHHWVIKNNVIRFANGVGIDFGNEGNSHSDLEVGDNGSANGASFNTIDSNYITDNGAAGTAAFLPSNIIFTNNVVERNINLNFIGKKRWESGAIKMHCPKNTIIANNLVRNNYGKWGIWLDCGTGKNTRVHGNLVIGSKVGFDLEIGGSSIDKLILDNNIFINNEQGISSRESGGLTVLHNTILDAKVVAISNIIDKKRTGNWSSDHQFYFNNVFLNCKSIVEVCSPDYYRSSDRRFDYNLYQVKEDDKLFIIRSNSKDLLTFANWKERWMDYNKGINCDKNSKDISGITYTFNDSTLTLDLRVDNDYLKSKTVTYPDVIADFSGFLIPKEVGLPGSFQNLKAGSNQLVLWKGIKPLEVNEMPYK
ncbi:MAG: right-handed parallel beta-helix repeat-containing protein [Paludibacter sp.]